MLSGTGDCDVKARNRLVAKLGSVVGTLEKRKMTLDRAALAFAGFVVLVSLALGYYVSPWFFLLTVFAERT
jgi:hypothetical protein